MFDWASTAMSLHSYCLMDKHGCKLACLVLLHDLANHTVAQRLAEAAATSSATAQAPTPAKAFMATRNVLRGKHVIVCYGRGKSNHVLLSLHRFVDAEI
jgi:hypothetical protein